MMTNKETHTLVISSMAPSYCQLCKLSGSELNNNPCPKQEIIDNGSGLQEQI